jgi:AcrR family transcriptional regulator
VVTQKLARAGKGRHGRGPGLKSGSEPRSGRRHERSQIRREQLLEAALRLFSEHGYAATSTKRIAEAAGVTEGLVFHYFPTKLELLLALASRRHTFAGRLLGRVQQADGSARRLLGEIAAGLVHVSSEEAKFIAVMLTESQTNEELRAIVGETTRVGVELIVQRLAEHVRRGELRADVDLDAAVHGFLGGFLFFLLQHRHADGIDFASAAASFTGSWAELCWRGMANPHFTE